MNDVLFFPLTSVLHFIHGGRVTAILWKAFIPLPTSVSVSMALVFCWSSEMAFIFGYWFVERTRECEGGREAHTYHKTLAIENGKETLS